jgi:hypothetical protein
MRRKSQKAGLEDPATRVAGEQEKEKNIAAASGRKLYEKV